MPIEVFGLVGKTPRGFPIVEFVDAYGKTASVSCSSAIGDYPDSFHRPGTSCVWLGINEAEPQIMASKAASHGVQTNATTGWVPFPVPEDVLLNTRMHLNREQVEGLVGRLQQWLAIGHFE